MEAEVLELSTKNSWDQVYAQIRIDSQSHNFTTHEASKAENRSLNRYRDVYPYDHSRVILEDHVTTDYINASLVNVPRACRKYILAQGPLPNTVDHFWLTVWQRRSKCVIMLNRVQEKGRVKCHQYWPMYAGDTFNMPAVNLALTHVDSDQGQHYTIRKLRLVNMDTDEAREILHFHFTTWPDFGVPECPDSFLSFLDAVRESGCLDEDVGPPVVHCSAGIGRSGTFCLVDTCLVLLAKVGAGSVCVRDVLVEMRSYRMGLIQTVDQFKFSYVAIVEGAKKLGLLADDVLPQLTPSSQKKKRPAKKSTSSSSSSSSSRSSSTDSSNFDDGLVVGVGDDDDEEEEQPPPLPPKRTDSLARNGPAPAHPRLTATSSAPPIGDESKSDANKTDASPTRCILNNHKMEERKREMELRRRKKDMEKAALDNKVQEMRRKARAAEEWSRKKAVVYERVVPFCVGLAMLLAGTLYYMKN